MTPEQFWSMTMIEFSCAVEGFSSFHASSSDTPLTKDELQDMMERYPD
tara:strand:+ start:1396 stop:1539 length:144 start_codon:yes stop_codon:yes gene_type:complete